MLNRGSTRQAGPRGVEVRAPRAADDRIQLARLGWVVVVGFLVGLLWPRLAGIRLAPVPPEEAASATPQVAKKAPEAEIEAEAESALPQTMTIGEAQIVGCKDESGKAQKDCDEVPFEDVLHPRLKTLAGCEAALGLVGTLSLGFDFDFAKNSVERPVIGKSTTVPKATAKALVDCLERELGTASLAKLGHQHSRYTVFFKVDFEPPPVKPGSEGQIIEATGLVTVRWNLALVREEPNSDSPIKARIRSGTRVVVTGRKADWYRIKFDAKGNEGWVFKSAVGL